MSTPAHGSALGVPSFSGLVVAHAPSQATDVAGLIITSPDQYMIVGGEYPEDCPDLLVTVVHAVDVEGRDLRQHVARVLADHLRLASRTAPDEDDRDAACRQLAALAGWRTPPDDADPAVVRMAVDAARERLRSVCARLGVDGG